MYQYRDRFFALFLFLLCGGTVLAQTSGSSNPTNGRENNPYSKFGIGELMNENSTVLRGMGSASSAYLNPYLVNVENPASYSFLERTTFEAGAMASSRTVTGSGLSYKTGTATLSYLNLAVPTSKNSGLCFGYRPYARSYYDMTDTSYGTSLGEVITLYNGEGSINYAFMGFSGKYKGLSIGANAGYMFGNMRNSTTMIPSDTSVTNRAYVADFTNYVRVGGIYWKGGLMYERALDSDYTIRIGGTISLQQKVNERLNSYQLSIYNFGDTVVHDTTDYHGEQYGKLTLPMSYSIGVMLVRNSKWGVAVDYSATKWSGYNSAPDATLNLNVGSGSYKISAGGELTPDVNNIRNYFSRVTYRLGAYYGTDYLKVNNTAMPYYGVTAGVSMPFKRTLSKLHASFDVGKMGTSANVLQQTFVRFNLGLSFNDKWFIPSKYD